MASEIRKGYIPPAYDPNNGGNGYRHVTEEEYKQAWANFVVRDPLVDRDCAYLDGKCNCEVPDADCKYSGKSFPTADKPMGSVKVKKVLKSFSELKDSF